MWRLVCVCSLKINLRVYSSELDGFWVLWLYGLITNAKQARLMWPRPIPKSEHVYASLTDTCGPRQSSDRLNTSEIKSEEHKSFMRTWKVVVFRVRRRTRTHERKVWHRNRKQETKKGRAIAGWCRWPAAGVFVCVRVDRSVEGGVACKLPEAGKVRVTCSASVSAQSALEERNSVFADEFVHLSISRLGAQSGDHPPAGESVITHTCGLCAASPHSLGCCFFFSSF